MAKIPIIMLNVKRESNLKEDEENNKKGGAEKMETEKDRWERSKTEWERESFGKK